VTLRRTLSFLELVREEVKQRTFRVRQYAVLESLYQGTTGWRQALIFSLLHRFGDPMYLEAQQADEEEKQYRRKMGIDYEPAGEPERQELLRLLEEEIASVREEFAYAEKANEESTAIERDACLAPEGEIWSMMLRQEAALDRSIDRKVRILLALRKESTSLTITPAGQHDGARMGNIEEVPDSDIASDKSENVEPVEDSKMKDQCGNVIENKRPAFREEKDSGVRIQDSGSRSQQSEVRTKGMGSPLPSALVEGRG
jgi:hypothetical protein